VGTSSFFPSPSSCITPGSLVNHCSFAGLNPFAMIRSKKTFTAAHLHAIQDLKDHNGHGVVDHGLLRLGESKKATAMTAMNGKPSFLDIMTG